jgi:Arc/MetJ-type ribon-helix-helix transcriptional regulator
MPTSVRLDPETERLLRRLERRRASPRSAVLRDAIRCLAKQELAGDAELSHWDALRPFIGQVDSGGLSLSTKTGRQFTDLLTSRRRARRSR